WGRAARVDHRDEHGGAVLGEQRCGAREEVHRGILMRPRRKSSALASRRAIRYGLVMLALLFQTALAAAGAPESITLGGQRAALTVDDKGPELELSVLAANKLPVPVEAIEIGILYA